MIVRILTLSIVAIAILYQVYQEREPFTFSNGSLIPQTPPPSPLTAEQVEAFHRDGYILVKGLVKDEMLKDAQTGARKVIDSFSLLDYIFKLFAKVSLQTWRERSELARLAFESSMPSISAQLLEEQTSIRVLKDALFAQVTENEGCGFHVDDAGFFPTSRDTGGIHFWIALDSFRVEEGGGLRLVNGSHTADYAEECRQVILAGYNRTCNIANLHPECNQKLQENSVLFDMSPGDALIWDRYTFHKTEPFRKAVEGKRSRYTIRYIPSNAIALEGGLLHKSVMPGQPFDSPYYPKVWPHADVNEVKAILKGLDGDTNIPKLFAIRILSKLGLMEDPFKPKDNN